MDQPILARLRLNRRHLLLQSLPWASGLAALPALPAWASEPAAAQVKLVQGEVQITSANGHHRQPLVGEAVHVGDLITTGPGSELHAQWSDGAYLAARPRSSIRVDAFRLQGDPQDLSWITLLQGGLRMVTGWIGKAHRPGFRLKTPVATIGIRGTDFELQHLGPTDGTPADELGTHILVLEGATVLFNDSGEVDVPEGQAAWVDREGQAPQKHEQVPAFLRRRRGRFEGLVDNEAANIKATILAKLQERSLATTGQTLQQRIDQFRQDNPDSTLSDRELLQRAQRRAAQHRGGKDGKGGGGGGGRR
ncbi:MAG TPA: FecR family protein [Burkholderiaceae bacterium]|nr:FecR family protein [Burkholderiaceae bacterium]